MAAETFDNSIPHTKQQSALHEEASKHLARPVRNPGSLKFDADGCVTVSEGTSLSRIALQSLASRGQSADGMKAEMDRIVALNVDKYPSLKQHPELIRIGWHLKVNDSGTQTVQTNEQAVWHDAPKDRTTVVHKGEHYVAQAGAWLVVEPGGEAILNAGSKAFAAPGSMIKMALPGSLVVAGGGEIHDYGARIQIQDERSSVKSKIVAEDVSALKPYQVAQQKQNDVAPLPRRLEPSSVLGSRDYSGEQFPRTQLAMSSYPNLPFIDVSGEK